MGGEGGVHWWGKREVGDEKEVEVTPPSSPPLFHLIPFHCILVGEFLVWLLVWKREGVWFVWWGGWQAKKTMEAL